jgi:hypothetical protein
MKEAVKGGKCPFMARLLIAWEEKILHAKRHRCNVNWIMGPVFEAW